MYGWVYAQKQNQSVCNTKSCVKVQYSADIHINHSLLPALIH